jgi:hypothetical protein
MECRLMNAKEALKGVLSSTQQIVSMYLSDLSDADLLVRPVPAANHIAWQLGHLIETEHGMGAFLPGAAYPALPSGFAEKHASTASKIDTPQSFFTKAQYLELFNGVREATIKGVEKLADADLDKPLTGEMAKWAPTVGALVLLTGNHTMMHAGQFTVVRRKLGKPVLF